VPYVIAIAPLFKYYPITGAAGELAVSFALNGLGEVLKAGLGGAFHELVS